MCLQEHFAGSRQKLPLVRWTPWPWIPRRLKTFWNKNVRKLSLVSFLLLESADAGNPTARGQFGAARESILPDSQLRPTSPCWKSPLPAGCSPRCPAARCCTPPPCSARGRSTRSPNARPANHLCLISAATAARGFCSFDYAQKLYLVQYGRYSKACCRFGEGKISRDYSLQFGETLQNVTQRFVLKFQAGSVKTLVMH